MQAVRRCRLGEHHAELARHAGPQQALLTGLAAPLRNLLMPAAFPAHDPQLRWSHQEKLMEIAYFIGAFVLLVALIYGTLQYHFRNRAATRMGGEIARERYRRDET
jgi:hypothetical protein